MKQPISILSLVSVWLWIAVSMASCRTDEVIYPAQETRVSEGTDEGGLFVLNEGNMGSNKAQIDYMDLRTGVYTRNIYGGANPDVVKELGDVGNDIRIFGQRLYAAINCSHKVEIMDMDCRRIGQVDIANCRYLAFSEDKMYVSAYVGSVAQADMLGSVYEVDTATLRILREVQVGHQPEEMAILDGKLYVANSGGYLVGKYDSTLSVIDLVSFQVEQNIVVGINPEHVIADTLGNIWVTCRGNHTDKDASVVCVHKGKVQDRLPIDAGTLSLAGSKLYALSPGEKILHVVDIVTHTTTISPIDLSPYEKPYGLLATDKRIYITDAKNYVSSGTLHAYTTDGQELWHATTGDIPGHLCLTGHAFAPVGVQTEEEQHIIVYDYTPAMGQFVNELPQYEEGDTPETMNLKAGKALQAGSPVSLGGWGGSITIGLDHSITNKEGADFRILGNAFYTANNDQYGSSEPGIVLVSRDDNHNGLPDDTWYELAGSEYTSPLTDHDYQKTYTREGDTVQNPFHQHPYYPQWIETNSLEIHGERIAHYPSPDGKTQQILSYGYADNQPNTNIVGTSMDISWAVNAAGQAVEIACIDFIRIYTAVDYIHPITGEISTEISGLVEL